MVPNQAINRLLPAIFLLCGCVCSSTAALDGVIALTSPSADIEMAFTVTGRVVAVHTEPGRKVASGETLIRLDDASLRIRHEQLLLDSGNDAEILAAAAEVKQKKQDLLKLEQAFEKGAATKIELEHSKLEVEIGEYRVQSARHAKRIALLKADEVEAEAREYVLKCPVDGVVESVDLEIGETAKASEKAIRIVRLDPLWAESSVPLEKYGGLVVGREIGLRFPDGTKAVGKVVFRAAVADSASETAKVRLEIPNPENRHAGERVTLVLDDE